MKLGPLRLLGFELSKLFFLSCLTLLLAGCPGDGGDDSPGRGVGPATPEISTFSADIPVLFTINEQSGSVVLSWSTKNVDASATGNSLTLKVEDTVIQDALPPQGSFTVSPTKVTTYTLVASNPQGTTTASTTVLVGSFMASQTELLTGQTAKLSWSIEGVDAVMITPEIGQQAGSGSIDVSPVTSTEYVLTIPTLVNARASLMLDVKAPLSSTIIANPTQGPSPLSVRFSSKVANNNLVITEYRWDFNDDGVIDRKDEFGAPQVYQYIGEPGQTFTARLTLIPVKGDPIIATQIITLTNSPAKVQATVSATNGRIPLAVTFTVNSTDSDRIRETRIDYDGDGTFDEKQAVDQTTQLASFTNTYTLAGLYKAVIEVEDRFGSITRVTQNAISVEANRANDPVVTLTASPNNVSAPATINLSATASVITGDTVTSWQWDLEGDDSFETIGGSTLTDTQTVNYQRVGNFYPRARVITAQGKAMAAVTVTTLPSELPIPKINNDSDTINIDESAAATIEIPLTFTTELAVWMEDINRQKVKTLQTATVTTPNKLTFSWDGTNEQGQAVSEGDYYVIVGYTANGGEQKIDLRETTGGALTYYRRTEDNPRSFNRLKKPLRINYAVDDPAEVSFFWQISFGAKLMTLMERVRMGRGQYSLDWNGDYPNGQKIPSTIQQFKQLMPGIVRYNLPDNVIFVKQRPRIEAFTLASTIMADPRREAIGINITVSKPGTIELVVADMDKGVDVATRRFNNLSAGAHKLQWNGKNNNDQYLTTGDYRMGVRSVDENGQRSLYWFRTQRIEY